MQSIDGQFDGAGPAAQDPLWFNGARMTIRAATEDSGGALSIVQVDAPGGRTTPLHTDPGCESFVVLEGALGFWIDGAEREARAGETVVVMPGVPHAFVVRSPSARFLVINSPAHERFFLEGGVRSTEPPPPSPEDRSRLAAAAANTGVAIIGPPPFSSAARATTA